VLRYKCYGKFKNNSGPRKAEHLLVTKNYLKEQKEFLTLLRLGIRIEAMAEVDKLAARPLGKGKKKGNLCWSR
jgi:hypothetical protein